MNTNASARLAVSCISKCLLLADSVEKFLAAVGTKFLRAADAFNSVRYGGPSRLEQELSATFFFA
jgi:hypothetical protein